MRISNSVVPETARRLTFTFLVFAALLTTAGCRELVTGTKRAESITLTPGNFELSVNSSQRLTGTAFDKNNNTIANKTIRFSSNNGAVATVTADGTVIGVSPGQAIISGEADNARGQAVVTVVPEVPASILVTPNPITLRRGNVRQLTATPRNASGSPMPGVSVSWQSSNSSIVSVSTSGEVTAVAPGSATVTASVNQVVGSSTITVTEIPIGSISLAPETRALRSGDTFIPDITLRDTASNPISSLGRPLVWSSSNELVASVTQSGVITGLRGGSARITAASPENQAINDAIDVTVSDRVAATVIVTPSSGQLRLGVPRQLSAQAYDSSGQPISGRAISWSSITPSSASVSFNGTVTGLALGTAQIVATVDGAADTVSFPVTRIPVGEVVVSPNQITVVQGTLSSFSATVRDSLGAQVSDRTINWSSNNIAVATVNPSTGEVTAVSPGTATISATSENRTGVASVTVLQIPVDSIRLTNALDSVVNVRSSGAGSIYQVPIELLSESGATLLNRPLLVTSSHPNNATAIWNQATRVLTVSGSLAGQANISLQALNQSGNPEGKITRIRVVVTNPVP